MQLEFDLRAEVLSFPFSRRRALVREAAERISVEADENIDGYWNALIRSLTDPLLFAGVPRSLVQAEANRFRDAVQAEIWRTGGNVGGVK
tara:strand:+ start:317 stop:586 length:270 start_codon:yes stop_codon:yes gene_type:complete